MLIIDHQRCTLCKLCIKTCPFAALSVENGLLACNENCTLCGACVSVCPFDALSIERSRLRAEALDEYKGVYVWVEMEGEGQSRKPRKVSFELLGRGRSLADDLGEELVAVVIDNQPTPSLQKLAEHGADRILLCLHESLAEYSTDGFTYAMCTVIAARKPSIVLYGATPHGRDFAPRVAARLKLGLTADCTGLEINAQRQLVQTRPAFGGNIMASILTPDRRPQMATVRPNVFEILPARTNPACVMETFPLSIQRTLIRTRVVERQRFPAQNEMPIEDARVIVSGGRGCQNAANLEWLRKLARQLGGVMAGSRAIVEQGWIPHTLQVGQSGTTVGPELYIAVGISGAIQHVVGMSSSKVIVAINNDPEAPIFKIADFGVVGDALSILPRLITLLKEQNGKEESSSG